MEEYGMGVPINKSNKVQKNQERVENIKGKIRTKRIVFAKNAEKLLQVIVEINKN